MCDGGQPAALDDRGQQAVLQPRRPVEHRHLPLQRVPGPLGLQGRGHLLVVQPGIVDRHRGDVGQRDQPPHVQVGEDGGPAPPHLQHADEFPVQVQRHRQRRPGLLPLGQRHEVRTDRPVVQVGVHLGRLAGVEHPAGQALTPAHPQPRGFRAPVPDARPHPDQLTFAEHDAADVRVQQAQDAFGDGRHDEVDVPHRQQLLHDLANHHRLRRRSTRAGLSDRPPGLLQQGQPDAGLGQQGPPPGLLRGRAPTQHHAAVRRHHATGSAPQVGIARVRGQHRQSAFRSGQHGPPVRDVDRRGHRAVDEPGRQGHQILGGRGRVGGLGLQQQGERFPGVDRTKVAAGGVQHRHRGHRRRRGSRCGHDIGPTSIGVRSRSAF